MVSLWPRRRPRRPCRRRLGIRCSSPRCTPLLRLTTTLEAVIGTWTPGPRLTCLLILVILPPSLPSPPTATSLLATVPHFPLHTSGTLLFLLIPCLHIYLT